MGHPKLQLTSIWTRLKQPRRRSGRCLAHSQDELKDLSHVMSHVRSCPFMSHDVTCMFAWFACHLMQLAQKIASQMLTSRGCNRPAASSAAARAMPVNSCTASTCAVGCLHSQFPSISCTCSTCSRSQQKQKKGAGMAESRFLLQLSLLLALQCLFHVIKWVSRSEMLPWGLPPANKDQAKFKSCESSGRRCWTHSAHSTQSTIWEASLLEI